MVYFRGRLKWRSSTRRGATVYNDAAPTFWQIPSQRVRFNHRRKEIFLIIENNEYMTRLCRDCDGIFFARESIYVTYIYVERLGSLLCLFDNYS